MTSHTKICDLFTQIDLWFIETIISVHRFPSVTMLYTQEDINRNQTYLLLYFINYSGIGEYLFVWERER
jgi:hypothetical protein